MNKPKREAETKLLTINEVAHREHVSPRTVRRQIESGELPYYRIGRAIRSEEDFADFLRRAKR